VLRGHHAAVGLAIILSLASGAGRADTIQDARDAYASQHYAIARQLWAGLAAKGNAEAEFALGLMDDLGQGGAVDAPSAFQWYSRAAGAGLPAAQFNRAVMQDAGRGTAQDRAGAATGYARAALSGHARAAFNLAQLYQAGDGVPRNARLAVSWYRLAAANGLPDAAHRAAELARERPPASTPLLPATLSAPDDGQVIAARPGAKPATDLATTKPVLPPPGKMVIDLVWAAPPSPGPVRFHVDLFLPDPGGLKSILGTDTALSAARIELDAVPAIYAWRVETTEESGQYRTVVSDPRVFVVGPSE
jgi:hypothetical protein